MIRLARVKSLLSVSEIAEAMGISKNMVWRVEDGSRTFSPVQLKKYCTITGANYNKLAKYTINSRVDQYKEKLEKEYFE